MIVFVPKPGNVIAQTQAVSEKNVLVICCQVINWM